MFRTQTSPTGRKTDIPQTDNSSKPDNSSKSPAKISSSLSEPRLLRLRQRRRGDHPPHCQAAEGGQHVHLRQSAATQQWQRRGSCQEVGRRAAQRGRESDKQFDRGPEQTRSRHGRFSKPSRALVQPLRPELHYGDRVPQQRIDYRRREQIRRPRRSVRQRQVEAESEHRLERIEVESAAVRDGSHDHHGAAAGGGKAAGNY